jgi:hypothetical protein
LGEKGLFRSRITAGSEGKAAHTGNFKEGSTLHPKQELLMQNIISGLGCQFIHYL